MEYRLRFGRKYPLNFLSHLEQIDMIRRIIRRSGLPVKYSSGFHPQLKISFGPAISVGYESEAEYIDIEFENILDVISIAKAIEKQLPYGFYLIEVKKLSVIDIASIEQTANLSEYWFKDEFIEELLKNKIEIEQTINKFLSQEKILIEKNKKNKIEIINVKPLIKDIKIFPQYISLFLRFDHKRNIKPEKIIQTIFNLEKDELNLINIVRKQLYHESPSGEISTL